MNWLKNNLIKVHSSWVKKNAHTSKAAIDGKVFVKTEIVKEKNID